MKLYRYETHIHTKETSPCGKVNASDLVRLYKEAGYHGIAITDHYYDGFFKKYNDSSWEGKIDVFLEGYRNAKEEGKILGLNVLLGIELRFADSPNDYLVYGVDEDFLINNKELHTMNVKDFRELVIQNGLMIYQAHPFRDGASVNNAGFVDGIEVFNGHPGHNSNNILAYLFAKEKGLKMLSGSDCHQIPHVARGGIEVEKELLSSKEFAEYLRTKDEIKLITTVSNIIP